MSPANKTRPLIAYIRQSRAKEKTVSLDEQREAISRWAKAHGERVVFDARYVEQNVSGAKKWQERELGAVIEELQQGRASGVIVAYQDRLQRPTWLQEAELWEALAKTDGRLVCAAEGTDFRPGDEEASDARMLYRIKGATARHAWERHCRNWRKGKHHAWQSGKYVADLPAGYSRTPEGGLTSNEHAEAIREAFRVKAEGGTWLEVARVLTAAQVPTSGGHGKKGTTTWTREGVQSVIHRKVYYGLHACTCGCGEEVVREEWEVVPRRLWKRANPATEGNGTVRHRGEGHALGGGLIRCSTCGAGLIKSATKGGRYRQMRCPGRGDGHPSITYEAALDHIVDAALEHVGSFQYQRQEGGNAEEIDAAQERLREAEEDLREVEALLGTKAPEGCRQRIAVEEAQAALDALDRSESVTRTFAMHPYQMRERFDTMPPSMQRRVLREIISRVVLSPGRGPAWERLRIAFADGTTWQEPEHVKVEPVDGDWFAAYDAA